jgi:LPS-assembly lipoprotein
MGAAVLRSLVLAASLAATGCGFQPLYGDRSQGSPAALSEVAIARIKDRAGQVLRNHLLDKMNPRGAPADAKYVLTVALTESIERIALRNDGTATRANLRVVATYLLYQTAPARDPGRPDSSVVFRATSVSTGSYNVLLNDFATLNSENDARRRILLELSEEIKNRVAIFLSRQLRPVEEPE